MRKTKNYNLGNGWGISCITENGGKFILEVCMLTVPWQEVVERFETNSKDEANNAYLRLKKKYLAMPL